jgi:hypothetical protein
MKTLNNISRTISRVSAVVILLVAFAAISFAGDVVEDELIVESWMITPFENTFETELTLEDWMVIPFEVSAVEGVLALETWMTTPFESSVIEAELALETWMTTPFEVSDCLLSSSD